MGWETRRGKRVYYRKVRDGRRVRSVYCGSGERGELAAREDEERRGRASSVVSDSPGKARTSGGESVKNPSIGAAVVTADAVTTYLEPAAAATLAKPSISSGEKTREIVRRLVAPPPRVVARPLAVAPRPRDYEEWRRARLRG